jgi:AcrR family transcriptional regulator
MHRTQSLRTERGPDDFPIPDPIMPSINPAIFIDGHRNNATRLAYRCNERKCKHPLCYANIRYVNGMSRRPDPERKSELVVRILDHLLDKSLSGVTFRSLASALGVSTFTLVYQFGTRAELISDVVAAISAREAGIHENLVANPASVEAYFDGLQRSWQWTLEPRNRQLQRLEFEASMIEALDPAAHSFVRSLFGRWQQIGRDALLSFGIDPQDAEEESRLVVDTFYGIQFDLVLNGDEERATAAFHRAVALHRDRLAQLMGQSA